MNISHHIQLDRVLLTFIQGEYSEILTEFEEIITQTMNKKWETKKIRLGENFDFTSIVSASYHQVIQCMLWRPKLLSSNTTAVLSNMPDGWPTLTNSYSKIFGRTIIRVRIIERSKFPLYEIEYINKLSRRVVQAMKDSDSWKFIQKGTALPFENEDNYKKRRISNRLNRSIIEEYLRLNGIDIINDDFWRSEHDAVVFMSDLLK